MDIELKENFRDRNNVQEIRTVIYNYLCIGPFDVGYYSVDQQFLKKIKQLPITCSSWRQFDVKEYGIYDPNVKEFTECHEKRVIFLNFSLEPFLQLRFRRHVRLATSVEFYTIDGYELKRDDECAYWSFDPLLPSL